MSKLHEHRSPARAGNTCSGRIPFGRRLRRRVSKMVLTLSLHAKIGVTDAGLDHGGPRPQHQEGIAAFAWKSGFKLQDEVGEVPVAVGDPLDQLRLVHIVLATAVDLPEPWGGYIQLLNEFAYHDCLTNLFDHIILFSSDESEPCPDCRRIESTDKPWQKDGDPWRIPSVGIV